MQKLLREGQVVSFRSYIVVSLLFIVLVCWAFSCAQDSPLGKVLQSVMDTEKSDHPNPQLQEHLSQALMLTFGCAIKNIQHVFVRNLGQL